MRIYKVDLDWIHGGWESDTDDEKAAYQRRASERQAKLASVGIELDAGTSIRNPCNVIMSETQVLDLLAKGEKIEIKQEIRVSDDLPSAMDRFNTMAEKLMQMPASERSFNERCEVHMPGQALATYNETMLLEDSCTDALQSALDQGWRIIAACPQPDQRRPDYILGRFNPQRQPDATALRRPETSHLSFA